MIFSEGFVMCFKQMVFLSLVDVAFLRFVAVWPLSVGHLIVYLPKCFSCSQRRVRFELELGSMPMSIQLAFSSDVNMRTCKFAAVQSRLQRFARSPFDFVAVCPLRYII